MSEKKRNVRSLLNKLVLIVVLLVILVVGIGGIAALTSKYDTLGDRGVVDKQSPPPSAPEVKSTLPHASPPPTSESNTISTPEPENNDASAETGISPEEAAQLLPLHPSQVMVEIVESMVVLKWRGTGESIIRYEVYRKIAGGGNWQQLGSVKPAEENLGWYEWKDVTAKSATSYTYGVSAINTFGTSSIITESAVVAFP